MSTVDMSSVDKKGLLTCQELTKIEMSSVDIFSLDEKFLTCFGRFFLRVQFYTTRSLDMIHYFWGKPESLLCLKPTVTSVKC